MQVFVGPVFEEGRLKLIKTIYHLIACSWSGFEKLCFVSVASMVCMSHAFVYDAVNVNKIIIISSTKPLSYPYVQVSTGLTLYLS